MGDSMSSTGNYKVLGVSLLLGFVFAGIVSLTKIGPGGFALEFLLVTPLREGLAGGSLVLGVALAFLSGASMILLPCGYPLLLTLTPNSLRTSTRSWTQLLLLFAVGIGGTMALVGVVVSLVGRFILNALLLASPASRVALSSLVYGALGVISVLLALRSLGFVKYSIPLPGFQTVSQLFSGRTMMLQGSRKRTLAFGALYGGGMAAGCPVPIYWALLFWAALIGNPAFGALLLGLHGIGYAAPVLAIGVLMRFGLSFVKSIPQKGASMESLLSGGLLTSGIFLILVFAVSIPVAYYFSNL